MVSGRQFKNKSTSTNEKSNTSHSIFKPKPSALQNLSIKPTASSISDDFYSQSNVPMEINWQNANVNFPAKFYEDAESDGAGDHNVFNNSFSKEINSFAFDNHVIPDALVCIETNSKTLSAEDTVRDSENSFYDKEQHLMFFNTEKVSVKPTCYTEGSYTNKIMNGALPFNPLSSCKPTFNNGCTDLSFDIHLPHLGSETAKSCSDNENANVSDAACNTNEDDCVEAAELFVQMSR